MLMLLCAGAAVTGSAFAFMARTNLRRWLGYNNACDVLFTIAMFTMLHGTFSGMIAASFAGILMSAALYIAKSSMGYERLERKGLRLHWVRYPGRMAKPQFKFQARAKAAWAKVEAWNNA